MNQLNTLIVEGNLVKDPESKELTNSKVCTFDIGINRSYKSQEKIQQEVTFIQVEAWAGLGESCAQYLKKGRSVRVIGRIKQNRWEDAEGKNRDRHIVVAEHIDFLQSPKKDDTSGKEDEEKEALAI